MIYGKQGFIFTSAYSRLNGLYRSFAFSEFGGQDVLSLRLIATEFTEGWPA
jgi:hypothetical protein